MVFDKKISAAPLLLGAAALVFPLFADVHFPLLDGKTVAWVEDAQSCWLLFGALFTLFYIRPGSLEEGKRQFWLWSVVWWLTLFGRGISWGRDFFPDGPRIVFRAISVVLIGTLVLSLFFSPMLRRNIVERFHHETLPIWTLAVVVVTFLISDTVEHHRLLAPLFLHNRAWQDLIEELYELPFMIGLFLIAFSMMKHEKAAVSSVRPHCRVDDVPNY
ncbi:hypothetical protein GIX45_15220 [Erwinia sp. CPCC 100877]|nr:hypothetical protein [Erwinia sp. CPCC 100877]